MVVDDDGGERRREQQKEKKLLLAKAVHGSPPSRLGLARLSADQKLLHRSANAILASQGEAGELKKGEEGGPEAQSPKSNIPFEPPGEISDAARKRTTNGVPPGPLLVWFVRGEARRRGGGGHNLSFLVCVCA